MSPQNSLPHRASRRQRGLRPINYPNSSLNSPPHANPITLPQNSPNENFATISSQQSYRSIPSIVNTIIDQQGLPTQLNLPSQISSNLSNPNHPTFHDEFSLHLFNQISDSRSEPSLHSFPPQHPSISSSITSRYPSSAPVRFTSTTYPNPSHSYQTYPPDSNHHNSSNPPRFTVDPNNTLHSTISDLQNMVNTLSQNVRDLTTDLQHTRSQNSQLLQTIHELRHPPNTPTNPHSSQRPDDLIDLTDSNNPPSHSNTSPSPPPTDHVSVPSSTSYPSVTPHP